MIRFTPDNIHLDINLDLRAQILHGMAIVSGILPPNCNEISLHLRGADVESVTIDEPVPFQVLDVIGAATKSCVPSEGLEPFQYKIESAIDNDVGELLIRVPESANDSMSDITSLSEGKRIDIAISYKISGSNGSLRFESSELSDVHNDSGNNVHYAFTPMTSSSSGPLLGEGLGPRTIFPCIDDFGEICKYTLSVSVNDLNSYDQLETSSGELIKIYVLASGEPVDVSRIPALTNKALRSYSKRWNFAIPYAVPASSVGFVVGPLSSLDVTKVHLMSNLNRQSNTHGSKNRRISNSEHSSTPIPNHQSSSNEKQHTDVHHFTGYSVKSSQSLSDSVSRISSTIVSSLNEAFPYQPELPRYLSKLDVVYLPDSVLRSVLPSLNTSGLEPNCPDSLFSPSLGFDPLLSVFYLSGIVILPASLLSSPDFFDPSLAGRRAIVFGISSAWLTNSFFAASAYDAWLLFGLRAFLVTIHLRSVRSVGQIMVQLQSSLEHALRMEEEHNLPPLHPILFFDNSKSLRPDLGDGVSSQAALDASSSASSRKTLEIESETHKELEPNDEKGKENSLNPLLAGVPVPVPRDSLLHPFREFHVAAKSPCFVAALSRIVSEESLFSAFSSLAIDSFHAISPSVIVSTDNAAKDRVAVRASAVRLSELQKSQRKDRGISLYALVELLTGPTTRSTRHAPFSGELSAVDALPVFDLVRNFALTSTSISLSVAVAYARNANVLEVAVEQVLRPGSAPARGWVTFTVLEASPEGSRLTAFAHARYIMEPRELLELPLHWRVDTGASGAGGTLSHGRARKNASERGTSETTAADEAFSVLSQTHVPEGDPDSSSNCPCVYFLVDPASVWLCRVHVQYPPSMAAALLQYESALHLQLPAIRALGQHLHPGSLAVVATAGIYSVERAANIAGADPLALPLLPCSGAQTSDYPGVAASLLISGRRGTAAQSTTSTTSTTAGASLRMRAERPLTPLFRLCAVLADFLPSNFIAPNAEGLYPNDLLISATPTDLQSGAGGLNKLALPNGHVVSLASPSAIQALEFALPAKIAALHAIATWQAGVMPEFDKPPKQQHSWAGLAFLLAFYQLQFFSVPSPPLLQLLENYRAYASSFHPSAAARNPPGGNPPASTNNNANTSSKRPTSKVLVPLFLYLVRWCARATEATCVALVHGGQPAQVALPSLQHHLLQRHCISALASLRHSGTIAVVPNCVLTFLTSILKAFDVSTSGAVSEPSSVHTLVTALASVAAASAGARQVSSLREKCLQSHTSSSSTSSNGVHINNNSANSSSSSISNNSTNSWISFLGLSTNNINNSSMSTQNDLSTLLSQSLGQGSLSLTSTELLVSAADALYERLCMELASLHYSPQTLQQQLLSTSDSESSSTLGRLSAAAGSLQGLSSASALTACSFLESRGLAPPRALLLARALLAPLHPKRGTPTPSSIRLAAFCALARAQQLYAVDSAAAAAAARALVQCSALSLTRGDVALCAQMLRVLLVLHCRSEQDPFGNSANSPNNERLSELSPSTLTRLVEDLNRLFPPQSTSNSSEMDENEEEGSIVRSGVGGSEIQLRASYSFADLAADLGLADISVSLKEQRLMAHLRMVPAARGVLQALGRPSEGLEHEAMTAATLLCMMVGSSGHGVSAASTALIRAVFGLFPVAPQEHALIQEMLPEQKPLLHTRDIFADKRREILSSWRAKLKLRQIGVLKYVAAAKFLQTATDTRVVKDMEEADEADAARVEEDVNIEHTEEILEARKSTK